MKFKADENLPVEVADLLRQHGHDAVTVAEQNLGNHTDSAVANVCRREERILVTLDMDFADIRTYPPSEFAGIIVLRVDDQGKGKILSLFPRVIRALETNPIKQQLWIVEKDRLRVRGGD